jgi:Tol biopolymer transport system component
MKKRRMALLTYLTIVTTLACSFISQPIQIFDSSPSENSSSNPTPSQNNGNEDDSSNPVFVMPNNEILAYLSYTVNLSPLSINVIELHLANPNNVGWDVCLTCELPDGFVWDPITYPPVWSPDHSKIAFWVARSESQPVFLDLYVANLDGSVNLLRAWETDKPVEPIAWSPDNQKILVAFGTEEYDTGFHIVDLENGSEEYIPIVGDVSFPIWLDKQTIAYISRREEGEISAIKLSTRSPKVLTQLNIYMDVDFAPIWSPTRDKLIVLGRLSNNEQEMYVVDMEGNVLTNLKAEDENALPIGISWSPDGKKILFTAKSSDNGGVDIYTVEPSTTLLSRITASPDSEIFPSWSPKGDKISFYKNTSIFTMSLDGTNVNPLVSLPDDATITSSMELSDFFIPIWR